MRVQLKRSIGFSVLLGAFPALVAAQALPVWRVVAGDSSEVISPGLAAGSIRQIVEPRLADRGLGHIGFRINSPTSPEGYWAWRNGRFERWAQKGVTGAAGPGRSDAESAHQFIDLQNGWGGAAADGQRLLAARAGNPAQLQNASFGLWRWNGSANIEIARGGTDGPLGPGLAPGWVFPSSSTFASATGLAGGQAMIFAWLNSPSGAESQAVLRHVPGQGNLACLRTLTSELGLSPGLLPNDRFEYINPGFQRFAVTPQGRIFAFLSMNNLRRGMFELCDGAPRALAATDEPGLRGPDVGVLGAEFTAFGRPQPYPGGGIVYFADWRLPPALPSRIALFHTDGGRNQAIALNEASGFYGPNWNNAVWNSFDTDSLSVASRWLAFAASATVPDGGSHGGIWRMRAGERPQLVALLDIAGAPFTPEAGRTWHRFEAFAMLSDGRVVLDATTNPGLTRDIWLLTAGQPPQRLLSIGQIMSVPTASGPVQAAITSYSLTGGSAPETGDDGWVAADGQLLATVRTNAFGLMLISTRIDQPDPNVIFKQGFE